MQTANGVVKGTHGANVHVKELDKFVNDKCGGRFSSSLVIWKCMRRNGALLPVETRRASPADPRGVTNECYSEDDVPFVAVTRQQGALAREDSSTRGRRQLCAGLVATLHGRTRRLSTGYTRLSGTTLNIGRKMKDLQKVVGRNEDAPTSTNRPVFVMCSHMFPHLRIVRLAR